MFWIGLIVGWLTAGPMALFALSLVAAAAKSLDD